MSKYDIYPAIFNYANDGITVAFPDFQDLVAEGQTDEEAYISAQDALEGLIAFKFHNENIPAPTTTELIETYVKFNESQRLQLIRISDSNIKQALMQKRVRRNITIPEYLNDAANKAGVNVSEIATQALKSALGL